MDLCPASTRLMCAANELGGIGTSGLSVDEEELLVFDEEGCLLFDDDEECILRTNYLLCHVSGSCVK